MSRSGLTSSTVRITSSKRVTSPRITGAPIGTSANAAAPGFRSIPTTDSPRAISFLMSRGPMKPVAPMTRIDMRSLLRVRNFRGLPGDHAPSHGALHVDGQIPNRKALLLARVLDVHLGDAIHDPDVAVHFRRPLTRRDPAVVRLAGLEVADVLALALAPRGRVHVDQIVSKRGIERRPVALTHRVEAAIVGLEYVGLGGGRLSG